MTHRLGKTVLHTCSDLFKPGQNFSHLSPPVPICSHLSTPVHTCSHLFTTVHTCSPLFTPVHTCSHLFTLVHTCSHLFTPVNTCSHLFTPLSLSTLFVQWQFLIEFYPCESCYFLILRPIPLKLQIFAHLIESFNGVLFV